MLATGQLLNHELKDLLTPRIRCAQALRWSFIAEVMFGVVQFQWRTQSCHPVVTVPWAEDSCANSSAGKRPLVEVKTRNEQVFQMSSSFNISAPCEGIWTFVFFWPWFVHSVTTKPQRVNFVVRPGTSHFDRNFFDWLIDTPNMAWSTRQTMIITIML